MLEASWLWETFRWTDALDIVVITFVIYRALVVMRGTRAIQSMVGLFILLLLYLTADFIGMAGIIINDSIVLVTTIDEYAKDHPFRQAVVNGVCDRLRAVVLTTATTVFGLAPLLFETSRQAQFLLPTVITLAYGLGVGLFLVILLVPALLVYVPVRLLRPRHARRHLPGIPAASGAARRAPAGMGGGG